jgi:hypothetical protein
MAFQIFARCLKAPGPGAMNADLQALIERLILFDHFILASNKLIELPDFINIFGYGPTLKLLQSGRLSIHYDAVTQASLGQRRAWLSGGKDADLPLGTFSFGTARLGQRDKVVSDGMKALEVQAHISGKSLIRMKRAIADRLLPQVQEEGDATIDQFNRDMAANHPLIQRLVTSQISEHLATPIEQSDVQIRLTRLSDRQVKGGTDDFRVESNLESKFGLTAESAHQLLERALMGGPGLNQRFEYMQRYKALTPFQASEAAFIDERIAVLLEQTNPNLLIDQFRRVVTLTGFPDLGDASESGQVSLERVLEIAESDECASFRQWIGGAGQLTDREIADAFGGVRAKLVGLASGAPGKLVRWVVGTGLGTIPGAGDLIGAAAGLVDSFLVEKILPKPGPVTFLRTHYQSIFDQQA